MDIKKVPQLRLDIKRPPPSPPWSPKLLPGARGSERAGGGRTWRRATLRCATVSSSYGDSTLAHCHGMRKHIVPFGKFDRIGGAPPETGPNVTYT